MNSRLLAYVLSALFLLLAAGSIASSASALSAVPPLAPVAQGDPAQKDKGKEGRALTPRQANACERLEKPHAARYSGAKRSYLEAVCAGRESAAGSTASGDAGLSPQVGQDRLVNNPALDSGNATTQSETSIAADDSGNVVSSYNNSRGSFTPTGQGWSVSHDNGDTWTDKGLLQGADGCCDPMTVWRRASDEFWIASLLDAGIGVYRSTDKGETFQYVGLAHTGSDDDRETMVVDNHPSSPYFGRFYIIWTDFNLASAPIRAIWSDTGMPNTWSQPLTIGTGEVQSSWADVSSDGSVFVSWYEELTDTTVKQHVARSVNGGVSYTDISPPGAANHVRVGAGFEGSCNRSAVRGNIRLSGAGRVAAGPNGTAHFAYEVGISQSGDHGDIYYTRYQGGSWTTPVKISDDATARDQFMVSIVASPQNHVTVAWYDRRTAPSATATEHQYYGVTSLDGGNSWGANYPIGDEVSGLPPLSPNFDPGVAACYYGDYNGHYANNAYTYLNWSDSRRIYNNRPDPDVYFDKNVNLTSFGGITGVITQCNTSELLAGVSITARHQVTPELTFGASTNSSGAYTMTVAPGSYTITGTRFGYITASQQNVTVSEGMTTTASFCLAASPSYTVSGTVSLPGGGPAIGSVVLVNGTPVTATVGADGSYSLALPEGTYQFTVRAPQGRRCAGDTTRTVTVPPSHTENFVLPALSDGYYSCDDTQPLQYQPAPNEFTGPYDRCRTATDVGDDCVKELALPFPYAFYGTTFTTVTLSTNGNLQFRSASFDFINDPLPTTDLNYAIMPFWDDLNPSARGDIYTGVVGSAPNRQFIVEWRNVAEYSGGTPTRAYTFTVSLHEGQQRVTTQYIAMVGDQGASATSGLQEGTGTAGQRYLQYSFNENVLRDGLRVEYYSSATPSTPTPTTTGTPPTATATRTGTPATATATRTGTPATATRTGTPATATATTSGTPVCVLTPAAADVPRAVPDTGVITSTLTVDSAVTIQSVKVTNLRFEHTYPADLEVFLISPRGTRVELFRDICSGRSQQWTGANTGFTLSDSGGARIGATCPPGGGTYQLQNSANTLAALAGEPANGTWRLEVRDDSAPDTGSLLGWGLEIQRTGCTVATATATTVVPTSTPPVCAITFADVSPSDYFYVPVQYLFCRGVISGYGDNTFRPFNNATRGQMTKIIVLAKSLPITRPSTPTFRDVGPDDPFFEYVETAVTRGIVGGYNDGTFRAYNDITRGQLSKVIVEAQGWTLVNPAIPTFRDVLNDNPFYGHIETAYERGIISGYRCGAGCLEFRWHLNATRAQISKIVHQAITGE